MAHTPKSHFVFRRNGRVYLNRRGASVQSTAGSRGVHISGSNAGYTTFRGSVKSTGYPLHSPASLSLPLPCVTVCHHISAGVYSRHSVGSCRIKRQIWRSMSPALINIENAKYPLIEDQLYDEYLVGASLPPCDHRPACNGIS